MTTDTIHAPTALPRSGRPTLCGTASPDGPPPEDDDGAEHHDDAEGCCDRRDDGDEDHDDDGGDSDGEHVPPLSLGRPAGSKDNACHGGWWLVGVVDANAPQPAKPGTEAEPIKLRHYPAPTAAAAGLGNQVSIRGSPCSPICSQVGGVGRTPCAPIVGDMAASAGVMASSHPEDP